MTDLECVIAASEATLSDLAEDYARRLAVPTPANDPLVLAQRNAVYALVRREERFLTNLRAVQNRVYG